MIKDHRTDYEVGNVQPVMDGELDGFIKAYLMMEKEPANTQLYFIMPEIIDTNVCIVGAGPAGSTTSITLSKLNIPHLIVDAAEFPRDKICGDALDLKVVRVLNNIDPSIVQHEFSANNFTHSMGMRFILHAEQILIHFYLIRLIKKQQM